MDIWNRIRKLVSLEAFVEGCVEAVVRSGNRLRTYFWNPDGLDRSLSNQGDGEREANPETMVDLLAGADLIHEIDEYIMPISNEYLDCKVMYITEELAKYDRGYRMFFKERLPRATYRRVGYSKKFFVAHFDGLRILLDPCDGTMNFLSKNENWNTTMAMATENGDIVMCVVYEPMNNQVHYAWLPDPLAETGGKAYSQDRLTGKRVDLVAEAAKRRARKLSDVGIGYHLTRSSREMRNQFYPYLDQLIEQTRSTYQENSGISSIRKVATGELGGFVNNFSPLWDAACAAPLVRAINGKVSDFSNAAIRITSGNRRTSLIVGESLELHSQLLSLSSEQILL